MKKIILITVLTGMMIRSTMAQFDTIPQAVTRYGFKVGNLNTGSGYNMGIEGSVFVESNGRLLAIGFFYDSEKNKIAGLTIHHEMSIGKSRSKAGLTFEKFIFYNFMLVKNTINPGDINESVFKSFYYNASLISMEHHLGIGCKIGLSNNIFVNIAVGYGRYLGSMKNASQPSAQSPIYKGSNGWGTLTKLNISYYL